MDTHTHSMDRQHTYAPAPPPPSSPPSRRGKRPAPPPWTHKRTRMQVRRGEPTAEGLVVLHNPPRTCTAATVDSAQLAFLLQEG